MRPAVTAAIVLSVVTFPVVAPAQQFTHAGPIAKLAVPVTVSDTSKFLGHIAHVGDDMIISGQPTEAALRELRAQGVTTIVNLRTPPEMTRSVKFDEPALAKELGITYVYLPVRGDSLYPYAPATVAKFGEAVSQAKGKVLLHCTVAWRASHLWAAYLIEERHVDVETALANARAIGLDDANPMMLGKGRQPVEEFLNRTLPTLGHAKH